MKKLHTSCITSSADSKYYTSLSEVVEQREFDFCTRMGGLQCGGINPEEFIMHTRYVGMIVKDKQ